MAVLCEKKFCIDISRKLFDSDKRTEGGSLIGPGGHALWETVGTTKSRKCNRVEDLRVARIKKGKLYAYGCLIRHRLRFRSSMRRLPQIDEVPQFLFNVHFLGPEIVGVFERFGQ